MPRSKVNVQGDSGDRIHVSMSLKPCVDYNSIGIEMGYETRIKANETPEETLLRATKFLVTHMNVEGPELYQAAWEEVEVAKAVSKSMKTKKENK